MAAVDADDSFTAESLTNLPGLALLINETDVAILLGLIGAENAATDIDAKSTAAALLYLAIGGWTLPANRLPELLYEISTSNACADFAEAIARPWHP